MSTKAPFSNYTTHGPSSSFHIKVGCHIPSSQFYGRDINIHQNKLPPPPDPVCFLYYVEPTCTEDQYAALANGTAEIVDFIVVKPVAGGGALSAGSGGF